MAKKKSILVEIFGRDKLTSKLGKMNARLTKIGAKMKNIGRNMTMRLTLPIVALGVISTSIFAGFDDNMRKVQAVSGATGQEFQEMTALAKEMGRTTRFTAGQAAEGMTFLGMAGLKTDKIMKALPGTLELAAAGGIQLSEAADIATNVMSAMKIPVKELGRINDVLAHTQANANTNILEMAEALEPVAGTARSMGVSLESLTAMIGQLANVGTKGSKAGRQLMNAFLEFGKKTGRPMREFPEFIDELNKKNVSAIEIMSRFGKIGGKAIVALMADGGTQIRKFTKELENSNGAAKRMAETMESGIGGTLRRVKSALEGVAITFGETLEPVVLKLSAFITSATVKFQGLNSAKKQTILIVLGLVAALGPLLIVLGTLATIVGALGLKIVAVGASIGALIGFIILLNKKWKELSIIGKVIITMFVPFIVLFMSAVKLVNLLAKGIGKLIEKLKSPEFKKFRALIKAAGRLVGKFLFKPVVEKGGAAEIVRTARERTLERIKTGSSEIKVKFENTPPGTTIKTEGGGNDLDVIMRGATLATP